MMKIEKNLLPVKAFYFFFYAASASLVPFLAVYYRGLGFDGSQIGLLASISPLMMLISSPLWGVVVDINQKHKMTLLIAIGGAIIMVTLLSQVSRFSMILVLVLGYAFFSAPIIPLVDNSVMTYLANRTWLYGKQRMWGAVGWGIAAPLIGSLTDEYGMFWIFLGYIFWLSLGFLVIIGFPIKPNQQRNSFLQILNNIGVKKEWILFLFTVYISGVNLAIVTNYLFLYLGEIGASRSMMGWGLTIATISEIPILFFSDKLILRFNAQGVLVLSLFASIIRVFGYAIAPTWRVALVLQIFHGLTFSAMWAAGVTYAEEIAPQGLGATAQSIFFSVLFGLSGITGALIGALLFENFGGRGMFIWSGSGVLLALIVFFLFSYISGRKNGREIIK